jgi:hypothetical protein
MLFVALGRARPRYCSKLRLDDFILARSDATNPLLEVGEMRGRSEEGIALIAVLWTLTLLSVIAIALSLETRTYCSQRR